MKKYVFALLVFALGCNAQNGKKLSADEFEKQLAENSNAILLDVRTGDEFSERHLENAVNIDYKSDSFARAIEHLDKSKTVFVYCLSGGRSGQATEELIKKGFKVHDLQGGILAWANAGKPLVENASEKGISMDDFISSVTKDKLVLVDFNATWCGPCKKLKPILHKLTQKQAEKLDLLEIDVDENATLADKMHIDAIPLLILYKNGKEVWRTTGLIEEKELSDVIAAN